MGVRSSLLFKFYSILRFLIDFRGYVFIHLKVLNFFQCMEDVCIAPHNSFGCWVMLPVRLTHHTSQSQLDEKNQVKTLSDGW